LQAVKRLLRGIEKHEPAWGDGGKAQAEGASYGASGPGDQNALVAKRSKARIREQRWPLQECVPVDFSEAGIGWARRIHALV